MGVACLVEDTCTATTHTDTDVLVMIHRLGSSYVERFIGLYSPILIAGLILIHVLRRPWILDTTDAYGLVSFIDCLIIVGFDRLRWKVMGSKILRVLRIILVVLPEHPSDTKVLTMKMEILLEPTSNKLLVDPHRSGGSRKDGDGDTSFQWSQFTTPCLHLMLPSSDKSKITRKQSKASKHGHENQEEYKAEAPKAQSLSQFSSPRAILAFLESYL
ncbi:hypothetical protein Tco_0017108 [Tanacetum coccineum]